MIITLTEMKQVQGKPKEVHPAEGQNCCRATAFGTVAARYDAFRPSPPDGALSILGELAARKVLEVGAGTGLWTRFLKRHGASVSVVEPDDGMRAIIERRSPGIPAFAARAEALPFEVDSFDLVLVGSAWHWFTQPDAINEMARVLCDNGTLAVLWNGPDSGVPWIAKLLAIRDQTPPENRRFHTAHVELANHGAFDDIRDVELKWIWCRSTEQLVGLFGTYSGVITSTERERNVMEDALRMELAQIPTGEMVAIPMMLRGTLARRSPRY